MQFVDITIIINRQLLIELTDAPPIECAGNDAGIVPCTVDWRYGKQTDEDLFIGELIANIQEQITEVLASQMRNMKQGQIDVYRTVFSAQDLIADKGRGYRRAMSFRGGLCPTWESVP